MPKREAMLSAHLFNGTGGATPLSWAEVVGPKDIDGPHWIQLQRTEKEAQEWLTRRVGLDPLISEALLAEETRPRCEPHGKGIFVILRGVNLNPGADPEDMVSIRLWIEPTRIVSLQKLNILAVRDIIEALAAGQGPRGIGDFLGHLARRLTFRMIGTIEGLVDELDEMEEQMLDNPSTGMRAGLSQLRRQSIVLRRYLAPQRDVLNRLQTEALDWIQPSDRLHLREAADQVTRLIEDLDAGRERAAITHEEIASIQAERMNQTMYILTLVASVFLPLGFLTGLLGINVGGIPGADSPLGFVVFCGILGAVAAVEMWLFRKLKWF